VANCVLSVLNKENDDDDDDDIQEIVDDAEDKLFSEIHNNPSHV